MTGLTADNKVYDRLLGATLSGTPSLVGVVSPDDVTIGAGVPVANFADKTVANGKPVTVSGYTLNGLDKADYSLTQPTGLLANITAKPLTITGLTANNKVYDRLLTATLTGTAGPVGVISGDTVTIAGSPSANFADKLVADNKPVTVSGYTLAGADALNYSVSQPAGLTANITPLGLTVSGVVANDRVYNGNNAATFNTSAYVLNTVIAGDTVTLNSSLASGTFADKNVGAAKPVTALGFGLAGADSGNYSLAQPTGLTRLHLPIHSHRLGHRRSQALRQQHVCHGAHEHQQVRCRRCHSGLHRRQLQRCECGHWQDRLRHRHHASAVRMRPTTICSAMRPAPRPPSARRS